MYKVNINDSINLETEYKDGLVLINGDAVEIDMASITPSRFHIIHQQKSYLAELVEVDFSQKKMTIKVNSNRYELAIKDQYDELLKNLGLDNLNTTKIKEIKAPMPGLVLKLLVKEGDDIKKGDNLFVLEAMKMENMIKSPSDAIIKKIFINPGDKVEKNQVMIGLG
ncbi:biotin/lipoyl-containing protein [Pedobacter cryophilus]|uniref:Biotin/lipoyl-binding protein n=1 Tax=Pedobacter cryophilus TaxID=2571271 RepID=A0A4U1BTI6_9SPHI|nr:acetyl-CoA carboxylase biotin carboxyl carrier protein subunit [Pedobacter cryophilus]TKB95775.1 biotin/lipoyl-binding protein [Pedobacter cryophilus]